MLYAIIYIKVKTDIKIGVCLFKNSSSMALQPGVDLASFKIRLQASLSLALSLHSFIPIFLRSVDTSSSHLIFGLPLRLVAYSFPYIYFGIAASCILSIWPNRRILWYLINLTMCSPLIMASNSSFRRILHNSFICHIIEPENNSSSESLLSIQHLHFLCLCARQM